MHNYIERAQNKYFQCRRRRDLLLIKLHLAKAYSKQNILKLKLEINFLYLGMRLSFTI